MAEFILSNIENKEAINNGINNAVNALEEIIKNGIDIAMNKYN